MYRRSLVALLLLLLAVPSFAYTVVLKDGSKVQAKKKYRISGKNAVITLVNGSESFLPLAEIDIPGTDRANQNDYGGTAVVIDSGKTQQGATAPPANAPRGSLADLIKSRDVSTRLPEPSVRPKGSGLSTGGGTPTASQPTRPSQSSPSARYEPPAKTSRRPFTNAAAADALSTYLRSQGIEEFRLYAGSRGGRVLLETTTASEASAFKALTVAANALLAIQSPEVSALELTMETPSGERAGTFLITPEQATALSANKIEVSAFYVQNVQF
ncbi:MAG TPA: hypothetical protein VN851_00265 [Thermoanaerobaculia bacterium]|nr:hypothetical protein [Thermoanaerobaculia bacterium]